MGEHEEAWHTAAARMAEAQERFGEQLRRKMAATTREETARIAGHIVDILAGKADDAVLDPETPDTTYTPAPSGIPAFLWHKPSLHGSAVVHCNAGEYVSDRYSSQKRLSVAFNAGFLAGALAARDGLIDTSQLAPPEPAPQPDTLPDNTSEE